MPQQYCADTLHMDTRPSRMHLLEMLEKRRFWLSLLCILAVLGAFSDMFMDTGSLSGVQTLAHKAIYLLQSLL